MSGSSAVVEVGSIQQRILLVRGERVIVDADLAEFYGVTTKALNQAVRRNKDRFPEDFVFRLTSGERSEVVTICDRLKRLKFSASSPHVFTEHGAIMAAAVLNSRRAVEMSVFVIRAFVALRRALSEHKELGLKVSRIERQIADHDREILALVRAMRGLSAPTARPSTRRIGFHSKEP